MEEIREDIQDKSHLHIHQDYVTLSLMVYDKTVAKENHLTPQIQSEYTIYYSMVAIVQIGMLGCCADVIIMDRLDYSIHIAPIFALVLIKCICSAALHMWLYPHFVRGMQLMKYVNNHSEYFDLPAIPFLITLINMLIVLAAEVLNLYLLLHQTNVELSIIHFVALEVIIEIPHFYSESLLEDKIKERIFKKHHHLHVHNRGKDLHFWSKRSFFGKIGRLIYCSFRLLYVSLIFYL